MERYTKLVSALTKFFRKFSRQTRSMKPDKYGAPNAYTFAELLAVLLILGLLMAIITPQILNQMERAKVKAAKIQAQGLVTTIEMMSADIGRIPTEQEGIISLLKAPSGADGWQGPYLRNTNYVIDPWGRSFQYRLNHESTTGFEIISLGSDGKLGGENSKADIVVN